MQRLREFHLEIGKHKLYDTLGLKRSLYDMTPVDDDEGLFVLYIRSPLKVMTDLALESKCSFGVAMQMMGDEIPRFREIMR